VLVVCASRKIFLFDVASGKETKVLDHDGGSITSLVFSPDSQRLLVCAWGKGVETKLPDGRTRFSAAKNHTAALWNVASGKVETTVLLPDGAIGPGAFSPDGSRFAVASGRRPSKVTVFKLSGELDAVLPEVPGRIWRLAFRHDGLSLITALDDSTALVWGPEALRDPPLP
jgi:WD40 repeat protein